MKPISIINVNTERRYAVVAYGDTTSFSTFVQRTIDDPTIHRSYLLDLYQSSFKYQAATGCFLKLLCDGFLAVHEFADVPPPAVVASLIEKLERIQTEVTAAGLKIQHPRPDLFRVTVAMGYVWALKLKTEIPEHCVAKNCDVTTIDDYFGYPTILAKRMLEGSHRTPIMICQTVKESVEPLMGHRYDFNPVPFERRIPSGVFKEDMASLWEIRRKTV